MNSSGEPLETGNKEQKSMGEEDKGQELERTADMELDNWDDDKEKKWHAELLEKGYSAQENKKGGTDFFHGEPPTIAFTQEGNKIFFKTDDPQVMVDTIQSAKEAGADIHFKKGLNDEVVQAMLYLEAQKAGVKCS